LAKPFATYVNQYTQMDTFEESGLRPEILKAVAKLGFVEPTPIQAKTIPHLLSSTQDVIALAQTGTGKTAAFGLPAIHLTDTDDKGTQTIILCPTRELCLQITKDMETYAKYMKDFGIVAVYGGASIEKQIKGLKKNAQIVVGTPGRVKDLINRGKLKLGNVARVILDEADEMLSMGFKDELETILAETPEDKQTLLFSATMSKRVLPITRKYMVNPEQMSVARINVAAKNVSHLFYIVHNRDRYELVKRIADMNPDIYGIVFCRTRRETNEIAARLQEDGYSADVLNGELSQGQRDEVMGRFRTKRIQMLVATDVAARGLDVEELTHVINYSLPDDPEVYTHRSGRTGRAGKHGISIVIVNNREKGRIWDIENYSNIDFTKGIVPTGKDVCRVQLLSLIDKIQKVEVDEAQIEPFMPEIYEKLESLDREKLIKHFVSSEFNRFLKYYKNARDIGQDKKREDRRRDDRRRTKYSRLFVNVGSKNDLTPTRLIGVINQALDSGDAMIGKIEVLKKFTFFEIEEGIAPQLIKALQGEAFEGVPLSVELSEAKPNRGWSPKEKKKKRNYGGGGRSGGRKKYRSRDDDRRGGRGGGGYGRKKKKKRD